MAVVVIMFELTGALTYILPTMACIRQFRVSSAHQSSDMIIVLADCASCYEGRWRLPWNDWHCRRSHTIQWLPVPG